VTARTAVVTLAALALVTTAEATPAADPGVTPTSVLLGGTVPLTGEAAAFGAIGPGAKAYFDYVNSKGGIHGRRVEYRYYDDAYNPAQTVQLTRRLVEQDKVFAVFSSIGTANNLAIRDYLNAQKVPQLWVGDGSQSIGRSFARYPWTMGFLMSYRGEGDVYGANLVRTRPRARIAILYENTELGRDMLTGLTRSISGKGPRIVAKQSYEFTGADVSGQVGLLKASGADTLMLFTTPKFTIQAFQYVNKLGWKPKIFVNAVSSASNVMILSSSRNQNKRVEGSISIVFLKDPNDPKWAKDPGVLLYRKIMKRFAKGGNPKDVYNLYGMSSAFTFVDALKHAGKNPTRQSLMNAVLRLNERNNPFLLPRMSIRTTSTDHYPIDQARLQRWHNGRWVSFGGLLKARS